MPLYTEVNIIFNPNSTGDGRKLAHALKTKLTQLSPKLAVEVVPTQRARHALELTQELAAKSKYPLIVSASGDGGYHEVINGVMKARAAGYDVTASLLPAGNANDHWNYMNDGKQAESIARGVRQWLDLLQVTINSPSGGNSYYAHSYAGIGLTPSVARELNRHKLNRLNEMWITCLSFIRLRPVTVIVQGKRNRYDSLIFSNVGRMSKYLRLAQQAAPNDGKFEITAFRTSERLRLLERILRAATFGLPEPPKLSAFSFTTVRETTMQLDGEILILPPDTTVSIEIAPSALPCVI